MMLRLKELRLDKGLSQQNVADFLGVSQQAYANYESGKREPEYESLVKLSEFFDTTTDYLLGKTDIKKAPGEKPEVTDEDIQFALFGGKVTDEAYEDVKRFAEFIKEKYKDRE